MIFKVLPDADIAWSDVWMGAFMTSLLFTIGKFAIGLYLGKSDVGSAYGAAGSLVILLVWVYYSAQILLFGAEFTQVYANNLGSRIVPSQNAVVSNPAKAKEVGVSDQRRPTRLATERDAKAGTAAAIQRSTAPVMYSGMTTTESPPWWFGIVVLAVSLTRFSRRSAK